MIISIMMTYIRHLLILIAIIYLILFNHIIKHHYSMIIMHQDLTFYQFLFCQVYFDLILMAILAYEHSFLSFIFILISFTNIFKVF